MIVQDIHVSEWIFNNPVCKSFKNFQKLGIDIDKDSPTDVKESIVMSAVCVCLPGIVYNLKKWRQINCRYAVCLGNDVLEKGYPTSYCHDERSQLLCNFVVGQIFEMIPFAWLYNQFSSMVQEFYANPISVVAAVSGCLCGGCTKRMFNWDYCSETKFEEKLVGGDAPPLKGILYFYCTIAKTAAKLGDAITAINKMRGEKYWTYETSGEWCEQAEELLD